MLSPCRWCHSKYENNFRVGPKYPCICTGKLQVELLPTDMQSPPRLHSPKRFRPYTDGRMEKGREFHCLHIPLQCSCLATNWETGLRVAESLFLRKSFIFLSLPFSRERREGNSFTVLLFLSVDVKIYSYCLLLLSNDKLWKKLII